MKTFVALNYSCNDNCISCPVKTLNLKDPSYDNIIKEIEDISKISNHIEFNGGEPTIRKDFFKIINYVNNKNFEHVSLLTNSQLFFYNDFAKKISNIKNLKIITTLYGHNEQLHDSISQNPGSFNKKIKGIKNLIDNNVKLELRILLHKMNYLNFNEMVNFITQNFQSNNFLTINILNPKLTHNALDNKENVSIKLSKLSNFLENPIKILTNSGFNVNLFHFPHCMLPKNLWSFSAGITTSISELYFSEFCIDCLMKSNCAGIWKSYHDIYGENELKQIKKSTDNYHIKLYYNQEQFSNVKFFYELFRINNIDIVNYNFYGKNYLLENECGSIKSKNIGITFKELSNRLDFTDSIDKKSIKEFLALKTAEILSQIHKIEDNTHSNHDEIVKNLFNSIKNKLNSMKTMSIHIKKFIDENIGSLNDFNSVIIHGDLHYDNLIIDYTQNNNDLNFIDNFSNKNIRSIDLDECSFFDANYDLARTQFFVDSENDAKMIETNYNNMMELNQDFSKKRLLYQMSFIMNDISLDKIPGNLIDYIENKISSEGYLLRCEILKEINGQ